MKPRRSTFHAGLDRNYLDLVAFDEVVDARSAIANAHTDYNNVKPG